MNVKIPKNRNELAFILLFLIFCLGGAAIIGGTKSGGNPLPVPSPSVVPLETQSMQMIGYNPPTPTPTPTSVPPNLSPTPTITLSPCTSGGICRFEKYELSYPYTNTYSNPYDPSVVDVEAKFTAPSGNVITVPGFYFQDFTRSGGLNKEILTPVAGSQKWKVRFAPSELGNYTYAVSIKDSAGTKTLGNGSFSVSPSLNPGFIRTSGFHFSFDNGKQFIPLGMNAPWFQNNTAPNKWGDGTYGVDSMYAIYSQNGANTFHLWTCSWNDGNPNPFAKPDIACNGSPQTTTQMNQPDSWEMDYIVDQAHSQNIFVLPILKHKDQANFDPGDGLYIRYVIARWGYSTNIFAWDTFKEGAYKLPTVSNYVSALRAADPYHHLITASEGNHAGVNNPGAFNGTQSLADISIVQNHDYSNDCKNPLDNDTALYAVHLMTTPPMDLRRFNKPSFFGETGMHPCAADGVSDINNALSPYVPQDTQGLILKGQIWGEFISTAGGMSPWNEAMTSSLSVFKGVSGFIANLPNSSVPDSAVPFTNYQNTGDVSVSNPLLEVMGRKNSIFAMLYIQNTTGTWAAILRDKKTPTPVTGTVTLYGMQTGTPFSVKWVNSDTGSLIRTDQVTSTANLVLTLPLAVTQSIAAVIMTP